MHTIEQTRVLRGQLRSAVLSGILCSLLALASAAAVAADNTKLVFLGNKNIAPVVYLDNGTPAGVVVDIVHALAKHISQPLEIRAMDWAEAQALVARGEADALIQINETEARRKIYDFSDTLLESQFSIFVSTDRVGIAGASSLQGLRVGVEAGGLPRQVLEKNPLISLTIIPNFLEGFKLLNAGAIDAVVVDYRVGSYVVAENKLRNIRITGEPIAFSYSAIAVRKGNTKLLAAINQALQTIKADGTYQKILDKWKPTEVVFQTREQIAQKIYYVTTGILLVLFLIAILWTVTLRKELAGRKAAEARLRRSNRALQTLSAGNLALVRAKSEDELLLAVTNILVEAGGYVLAAVDYAENDPEKTITPMAWSGFENSHYWAEHLSWADTEFGQLPVSRAIRSGMTQVCHDIASDPAFKPLRDAALSRGYVSNIALPLTDKTRTFGGLSIYSSSAEDFDEEEVRLLEELASDLAYGIIALRTRVAHEQQAIALQQSLEQSIQTIAATVEARDPYTAGHQRRVAALATAIAQEMDLPEEQINGIHLAAIIHDLGKIQIPAEILSKPSKLSDIEFMLIKQHPQAGYDILKDVKFPWPIAEVILQHHERMDGSGYPQGLKSEQILLESKIMAVADVVEAMSSHRPYRPGFGIEAALDEIILGRGTRYDPQVVDACVALLQEKKYVIPD